MNRFQPISSFCLAGLLVILLAQNTEACPSFNLFSGLSSADSPCDQALNYERCEFSSSACCDSSQQCVDPSSANFNDTAAACTRCTVPPPDLDLNSGGFCSFYTNVKSCWDANNCDTVFTTGVLPRNNLMVATDLCSQIDECSSIASDIYRCLFAPGDLFRPGDCESFARVEACFAESQCSPTFTLSLTKFARGCLGMEAGFVPEFCTPAVQSPTNPLSLLTLTEEYENSECGLTVNTVECNYDRGACCSVNPATFTTEYRFGRVPCNENSRSPATPGGQYPQVRTCMECLGDGIGDPPLSPESLCSWTSANLECIRTSCSGLTDIPEIQELVLVSEIMDLVCSGPLVGCSVEQARECTLCEGISCRPPMPLARGLSPDSSPVNDRRNLQPLEPSCSLRANEECFTRSGCDSSVFRKYVEQLALAQERQPEALLAECLGCDRVEVSIDVSGGPNPRKCDPLSLVGAASSSEFCLIPPSWSSYFEDPNFLTDFSFHWKFSFENSAGTEIEEYYGPEANFLPYMRLDGDQVRVTLEVSSFLVPEVKGSTENTILFTQTGPVLAYDLLSTSPDNRIIDASRSCFPDRAGCISCSNEGYVSTLPEDPLGILMTTGLYLPDARRDYYLNFRFTTSLGAEFYLPLDRPGNTALRRTLLPEDFASSEFLALDLELLREGSAEVYASASFTFDSPVTAVVPPECPAAVLRLYSSGSRPTSESAVDSFCDFQNNVEACLFDGGACCSAETTEEGLPCIDPASPIFTEQAVQCMQCLDRGEAGFCEFFDSFQSCLDSNRCFGAYELAIPPVAAFIASDLCQQDNCPEAEAETILDCVYDLFGQELGFFSDEPCTISVKIEECFLPLSECKPRVIQRFMERRSSVGFSRLPPDCEGKIETLDFRRCASNEIVTVRQLERPFNPSLVRDFVGNSNCDPQFNIEECNFDGGDCCTTESPGDHLCVEDNAYSSLTECQQCFSAEVLDLAKLEETLCPHVLGTKDCIEASCTEDVRDNFASLVQMAKLCEIPSCEAHQVIPCVSQGMSALFPRILAKRNSVQPAEDVQASAGQRSSERHLQTISCPLYELFAECFRGTTCPKRFIYDGSLGAEATTDIPPETLLAECYDCSAASIEDSSVTARGSRKCEDVRISIQPRIERSCARGIEALFGIEESGTSAFRYLWRLDGLSEFQEQEDRSFIFKPYEAGISSLSASVDVFASFLVEPVQFLSEFTFTDSKLVAQTSEIGTIVVYTGEAGIPVLSINAYRSCDPDVIGCKRCTATGLNEPLKDTEEEIIEQTGMYPVRETPVRYEWRIECEDEICMNPEGLRVNRPVLQIPNADLSPEKSPYRITLQINRLGAPVVAAAPIVVQVIDGSAIDRDCDVPSLKISSDRAALSFDEENDVQVLVINRQERSNLLRASVFSNDGTPIGDLRNAPFDLEWSFDGSVVASGRLFAIDNELLSSVSPPYTFTLTARQPCTEGADPFARITLRQNLPPSGGSITVSPAVGDSLSTKFMFNATGWTDPEGHLPLQFAFFADGSILRRASGNAKVNGIVLSGSGNVQTFVRVFDSLGGKVDSAPFIVNVRTKGVDEISSTVFNEVAREGADDEQLIDYISGVIKLVNEERNVSLQETAKTLRKAAFDTLKGAADSRRNESASTLDDIVRTTKTLTEVLSDPDQLDEEDFDEFAGFYKELLEDTAGEDLNSANGEEGSLFEDVLQGTATLLLALIREPLGRRLQANEARCNNIGSLRDVVKDVGLVVTKDDASGAFVRQVNATGIRLAAATTPGDEIGSLSFGDVTVNVPKDIGAGSGDLTTVLSQFDFNIRVCEDTDEDLLDKVTSEDKCIETLNVSKEGTPIKPPENVISLEFRSTLANGGEIAVEPVDLDEPIVLTLPLGDLELDNRGLCSNFTALTCGYYSEEDSGFRTAGCNVTNVDIAAGTLECTCNHASDYAAWVAFQQDVIDVFTKPLSVVTLLGIVLAAAIVASVFITYCLCSAWGNHRDQTSARALQKEAVGVMLLNRFLLRQRQRQFFLNLKEAVEAAKDPNVVPAQPTTSKQTSFCKRMITAIRYEHSLLGLVRYDPHYTRIQRVSIFTAVVLGNLFIAALFFELKDSEIDDLSPGFVFLVVLVSSLAVAIPIRLIIKMLFRITDYRSGSNADRIAQLYRVSLAAERDFQLVMNSPKDVELIQSFKEVYLWKERVRNLGGANGSACCCGSSQTKREEDLLQVGNMSVDGGEAGENITVSAESKLARARQKLEIAQKRLRDATIAAKEDWKQRSNEVALERVRAVNRQKSRLMQVTALLADDSSPKAKTRRALCPYWMVYVSWLLLLGLYTLAVYYVIRFVLTRADRAALPTVTRTENELIGVWLVSASLGILVGYCIAEPLIAVTRYACLPYCLLKCGTAKPEVEEDEEEDADGEDILEESSTDFYASMKALDIKTTGRTTAEKRDKRAAESARGQYVLEFISDLLETIY